MSLPREARFVSLDGGSTVHRSVYYIELAYAASVFTFLVRYGLPKKYIALVLAFPKNNFFNRDEAISQIKLSFVASILRYKNIVGF